MIEDNEVLKIYCDKQKVMIADLVSKVLMLETKLEFLEAQRKVDIEKFVKEDVESNSEIKKRENINTKKPNNNGRTGQLR